MARIPRLPMTGEPAVYHVISRTALDGFVLWEAEKEYLLGTRDPGRVTRSPLARLLNLMWPLMQGDDPGTLLFSSTWNMLDQFLVSKEFIRNTSKVKVVDGSTATFKPQQLKGPAGAAKKYGRPSQPSSFDQTGFSDHYPIVMRIETNSN